mgnify:CR=1 FL=1
MLALLYYLNRPQLSIGCKRFLYGKNERHIARRFLHETDDSVGCRNGIRLGDPSSDEPYRIELFGSEQEVFYCCTGLVDCDSRENSSVGELSVQSDFHVTSSLEFLENNFVHSGTCLNERSCKDRKASAVLDVSCRTEESLRSVE